MKKISEEEVKKRLSQTENWSLNSKGQIERKFEFKDFKESMQFVNAVAFFAEKLDHHPDILILWNKVCLSINTHSAGGITDLDFQLAKFANELLVIKRP